uniref:Uncharacterized protein n=1 Tax=Lutzomyia longipalpis TaxID=7200 RepID=A0A1B0CDC1_LUTLO
MLPRAAAEAPQLMSIGVAGLQSLWVTTWCSSELQRKNQQLPPATIHDRRPPVATLAPPTGSQSSEKLIVTPSSETG